jgi:LRP1 type putative zinc finger protein
MKRRRHYEIDLSLLPPLASLVPEELKNFSKEELAAYLESKGIQPKFTKPEMKRQLRLVIQAIKEDQPEILQKLREDGLRELVETPKKLSRPADFVRQVPTSTPIAASTDDKDKRPCLSPGCRKKANKECEFQRCRSCCTREGFLCYVHMHDLGRRGHESALYRDHPFVNGTASISNLLPLSKVLHQRATGREGAGPMLPPGAVQAGATPYPLHSGLSSAIDASTQAGAGAAPSRWPPLLPPSQQPRQWTRQCPSCHKQIFAGGSHLLLHLHECDPQALRALLCLDADSAVEGLITKRRGRGRPKKVAPPAAPSPATPLLKEGEPRDEPDPLRSSGPPHAEPSERALSHSGAQAPAPPASHGALPLDLSIDALWADDHSLSQHHRSPNSAATPLLVAKQLALRRFLRRDQLLNTLFAATPTEPILLHLTDEYLKRDRLKNLQENQQRIEELIESLGSGESHELRVEEHSLQAHLFGQHMACLEAAQSLQEVEECTAEFEQDFGMLYSTAASGPQPADMGELELTVL